MKNITYLLAMVALAALFGCSGSGNQKTEIKVNLGGYQPGKHSFMATFKGDSANMDLIIADYGDVTGKLYISFAEPDSSGKPKGPNVGDIVKGAFKGDTLYADYNFKSGANKYVYTNPLVFLRKGDTLIMGSGRIMQYLGRNYYEPSTINFEKSKFRFVPIPSK